jgi:hypothetical protein
LKTAAFLHFHKFQRSPVSTASASAWKGIPVQAGQRSKELQPVKGRRRKSKGTPETPGAVTVKEQMFSVLRRVTQGARSIIVCTAGAKASIGVKLAVMEQPEEGFETWWSRILPNTGGKSIIE